MFNKGKWLINKLEDRQTEDSTPWRGSQTEYPSGLCFEYQSMYHHTMGMIWVKDYKERESDFWGLIFRFVCMEVIFIVECF